MKKNTLTMHLLEEPTNFLNKMIVKHIKRIQFSIHLLDEHMKFLNYSKVHEKNIQITIRLVEKRTIFLKTMIKYMKRVHKKLKYFIT